MISFTQLNLISTDRVGKTKAVSSHVSQVHGVKEFAFPFNLRIGFRFIILIMEGWAGEMGADIAAISEIPKSADRMCARMCPWKLGQLANLLHTKKGAELTPHLLEHMGTHKGSGK